MIAGTRFEQQMSLLIDILDQAVRSYNYWEKKKYDFAKGKVEE